MTRDIGEGSVAILANSIVTAGQDTLSFTFKACRGQTRGVPFACDSP